VKEPVGRLDIDGKITLKWILKKWDEKCGLGSRVDQWEAAVNMVMNLQIP
jgi:hypothetical protein